MEYISIVNLPSFFITHLHVMQHKNSKYFYTENVLSFYFVFEVFETLKTLQNHE